MYRMVNSGGNAHITAATERERDRLLQRGFRIEEEKPKEQPKPAPKKRKVAKTDED